MTENVIWRYILEQLQEYGEAFLALFELRPPTDTVAFSIAFIALAAKLAKADGQVTRDEVSMFRSIFEIPPSEEANAARVFNLCRQETTGFESYAYKMARAIRVVPEADEILTNVLDGLFCVAMADDEFHENEDLYLRRVAEIFELEQTVYLRLRARHVPGHYDPYTVLGIGPGASMDEIRRVRRRLVAENHPDRLMARGLPAEMIKLAETRLIAINTAFEDLEKRGLDA